ncbi:MAG: NAD(P)H-dependent oxidoreductase subunit E [Clostridiales bacterium]|nr:NAD(P)H-dependent oxidoreductase subunit E [Clostridiales bacterium]
MSVQNILAFEKAGQIIEKYGYNRAKLIPILQEIQNEYRYLPEELMVYVATMLGTTSSHVYGVASFYSHFTLKLKGKYVVRVCDGTACHVKKSTRLLEAVRAHLRLAEDQNTTPDFLFTVETVACLGTCGRAPAMSINGEVYGLLTDETAVAVIRDIQDKEQASHE